VLRALGTGPAKKWVSDKAILIDIAARTMVVTIEQNETGLEVNITGT